MRRPPKVTARTTPTPDSDSNRTLTCLKCGREYPDFMTFCPYCYDDQEADLETILDPTAMLNLMERDREAQRDSWLVEQYESQAYARAVMHEDSMGRGWVTHRSAAVEQTEQSAAA